MAIADLKCIAPLLRTPLISQGGLLHRVTLCQSVASSMRVPSQMYDIRSGIGGGNLLQRVQTMGPSRPACVALDRASHGVNRTILRVEDEDFVREVACEMLSAAGSHV